MKTAVMSCTCTWCEGHAIRQHGALDDVEVGPHVECEEAEAHHAHALHGDHHEGVHGGGPGRRLEADHAHRAQEGEHFGDAEGDEEHPHPNHLEGEYGRYRWDNGTLFCFL